MATETYRRELGTWRSMVSGSLLYDDLGPPDEMPNADNTGWEHTGVTLEPYVGTHFFTEDTVIVEKEITKDALYVRNGAKLTILRCQANVQYIDCTGDPDVFLHMEDTKVTGSTWIGPTVGYQNMLLRRCDIAMGQHSVICSVNGLIEYCWLHDQWNDPDAVDGFHNNGFLSNGGNDVTIRYNTIDCSTELTPNGGGPTGDASIFGDFAEVHHYTFKGNLFKPTTGSYGLSCGYNPAKPFGSTPHHIVVVDNIFEKGPTGINGVYGPVTSFLTAGPGNIWQNNKYDDGSVVNSA